MKEHRHVAIMFTDIVNYTALMGSDEERAFDILRKNRDIHQEFLKKYNGKLIKEMGDGMLISFELGSNAVRCAIEIQIACRQNDIPLRIGVHEGEVIFDDSDVFGDGVNIASRLQSATEAGGISISGSVFRDIKNKADITVQYIGEEHFKNIDEPIKRYDVKSEHLPDPNQALINLSNESKRWRRIRSRLIKITPIVIGSLAIAITVFVIYGSKSIPFTERDWIVISDFENLTDEPLLDHSLNTAFILSIHQSRYLNVMTRQRMIETLKRMKNENDSIINEESAREIAIREGVEIYIVPTISKIGTQYILTAKILDSHTGNTLQSEMLYAKNQNVIIEKLDQLSKKVRRRLGESSVRILDQSKPLKKVTTSSLNALKQYSLGIESHLRLNFNKARMHYESAIALDSNFTAAKASLGNLLYEKFDPKEGRKWLDNAIVSIDDLTEREKMGILAFYAVNVENDIEKGIDYTNKLLALYPDDPAAHNNLGWYFQKQGKYEQALEEYKAALAINPYMMLTLSGINWVYLDYLSQVDSAMVWSDRMISTDPENPWGYFYLGSSYVGMNDWSKAEVSFKKAIELDPTFVMSQYRLAHVYRLQGKFSSAIEVLEGILRNFPHEFSSHYDLGINYNLMGQRTLAKEHYLQYQKVAETWLETFKDDPKSYIYNGIVRTRLGDKDGGWEIGKLALDLNNSTNFEFAQLLAVQGREIEALDYLEKALERGYKNLVWIKLNPDMQVLHDKDRFTKLIKTYLGN